jgi:hypothetical protein
LSVFDKFIDAAKLFPLTKYPPELDNEIETTYSVLALAKRCNDPNSKPDVKRRTKPSSEPAGVLLWIPVEGSKSVTALKSPTAIASPDERYSSPEMFALIVPRDEMTPVVETSTNSPVSSCARRVPDEESAAERGELFVAPNERGTPYRITPVLPKDTKYEF